MKKRKFMKKLLSFMMVAILSIGLLPTNVFAESEPVVYLAIGDSITTGYGLSDADSQCFVTLFAEELEATTVNNSGVSGLTAANLLTAISSGTYDKTIASADVITLTIGGNDLMAVVYDYMATAYNSAYNTSYDADDIQDMLSDITSNYQVVSNLITLMSDTTVAAGLSVQLYTAGTTVISNIGSILAAIKQLNSDVVILLANQYNPYTALNGTTYSSIYSLFQTCVTTFNSSLSTAVGSLCTIVDVAKAGVSTNVSLSLNSMSLDFHPDKDGHQTIADAMTTAYAAVADCTVTFVADGGKVYDGADSEIESITVDWSTSVNLSDYTAKKDGYIFTGWYSDSALTEEITDAITIKSDTTVYAGFREDVYTWEIPIEVTVENAGSAQAPTEEFELVVTNLNSESVQGLTMSVNTVETSGAGTYTVTLKFTGDSDVESDLSDGFNLQLKDNGSTGWTYDDEVYYVLAYMDDSTGEIAELAIYSEDDTPTDAVFTCTYTGWTLSFETDGGDELDSVEAANGTTIDLSDYEPEKDGYTFTGWYSDSELTEEVTEITLTQDATVYAGWEEADDSGTENNGSGNETEDEEESTKAVTATSDDTSSTSPKTGDNLERILVLIIALAGGMALVAKKKLKETKE